LALYTTLASLSQTAASNVADGAVDAPSTIDQQTNLLASFIAQLRDGNGFTTGVGYTAQCRLIKSGSNLVLSRYNGVGLTINGVAYTIPSAGVSLAPTGSAGTTYNIYAYMNAGTMTLEASTTAHATDSTTGIEIKSGDATRTLVGMARPTTGPAWTDATNQRFVVSYFNRRPLHCQAVLGASTGTSSTSGVELSTTLRNEFLGWADSAVDFGFDGYASNSSTPATVATFLSLDGAILETYNVFLNTAVNQLGPVAVRAVTTLSEGYHFISPYVSVNTGTGTWVGSGTPGLRSVCKGVIWG
jgi:hypothetical protein